MAYLTRQLSGFIVRTIRETGSKVVRAQPVASQAEIGNIKLTKGHWNKNFLTELDSFPEVKHDDQVDTLSGAFSILKDFNQDHMPQVIRL